MSDKIKRILKAKIKAAGGVTEFARQVDVSHSYVCNVMAGQRSPGRKILDAIGFERIVTYRPKGLPK